MIIGWVALWKPVEFYLYDRRDLLDDQEIPEVLSAIPVETRLWSRDIENETLVLMQISPEKTLLENIIVPQPADACCDREKTQ